MSYDAGFSPEEIKFEANNPVAAKGLDNVQSCGGAFTMSANGPVDANGKPLPEFSLVEQDIQEEVSADGEVTRTTRDSRTRASADGSVGNGGGKQVSKFRPSGSKLGAPKPGGSNP